MADINSDLEEYDDGLSPQPAQNDLGDFTIRWLPTERRFESATIRAKLIMRGKEGDIPFSVENTETKPKGIVEVIQDLAASTPSEAVFDARLTKAVMKSPDFYDQVARPITVTITVVSSSPTMSLITTAPETIDQTCTVDIEVPRPSIHWTDAKRPGVRDPVFELEADGEDDMELHVWLERWDPVAMRVGPADHMEFSHMTNKRFDPEVFGPCGDSKPWQKRPEDNRFCSYWKSNLALPDTNRPETLPWDGLIRVRAWNEGDILRRAVNRVWPKADAHPLAEGFVPVVLGPARITARLVSPDEPICADDRPHEIVVQFLNVRSGKPVEHAQVSWELATGARFPGGMIDRNTATIAKGDDGKVRFNYAPPKLTYTPGASYDQDIRCFVGAGDARRDAGGVTVFVSPEIRAELTAKKCGLDFEPSFPLTIPCDVAPDRIVGHVGFASIHPGFPDNFDVYDAVPLVTVTTVDGPVELTIEPRTDTKGVYSWSLPELTPGLAKLAVSTPRRTRILEPFRDESVGDLDAVALAIVERYRNRLNNGYPKFSQLVPAKMTLDLARQPQVMARHLCDKLEEKCEKCKEGLRIEEAVLAATELVDRMADHLLEVGVQNLGEFIKALWDLLNEFIQLGEMIFGVLAKLGGKVLPYVIPPLRGMINMALPLLQRFFPGAAFRIALTMEAMSKGMIAPEKVVEQLWREASGAFMGAIRESMKEISKKAIEAIERAVAAGMLSKAAGLAQQQAVKAIDNLIEAIVAAPAQAYPTAAKEMLRDMLGLTKMSSAATGAIGATIQNIEGFEPYRGAAGDGAAYLKRMQKLAYELGQRENYRTNLSNTFDGLTASADFLMTVATAVVFLSGFLAVGTLGAGAGPAIAAGVAALAAREAAKKAIEKILALAKIGAKGYLGYLLIAAYAALLTDYELRTLEVVGSPPSATP